MKQSMVSRKAGLCVVFLLVFFFTAFNVLASGKKEKSPAGTGGKNTTTLVGRVQIYGNEPNTFVGIVDEHDVAYSIYPPNPNSEAELRKLQGHLIEFTVILLDKPQDYAGKVLGRTLTLIDWKVTK
jgi:hypothetical protein